VCERERDTTEEEKKRTEDKFKKFEHRSLGLQQKAPLKDRVTRTYHTGIYSVSYRGSDSERDSKNTRKHERARHREAVRKRALQTDAERERAS